MAELTPEQQTNIVNRYNSLKSSGDTVGADDFLQQVRQRVGDVPGLPQPSDVSVSNVGQFVTQGLGQDVQSAGALARGTGNLLVSGAIGLTKDVRSLGGRAIDFAKEHPAETAATIASFFPPTVLEGGLVKLGLLASKAGKVAKVASGIEQGKNIKTVKDIGKLALSSGAIEGTAGGVAQFVDNTYKGQSFPDAITGAIDEGLNQAIIGTVGTATGELGIRTLNKVVTKGGGRNKELLIVSDLMASDKRFLNDVARTDAVLSRFIKNGELDISAIKLDEVSPNPIAGIIQRFSELFPTTSARVKALDSLRARYSLHKLTSFLSPEAKKRLDIVGDVFRDGYLETIDKGIAESIDKKWLQFVNRSKKGFDDFTDLAGFKTKTVTTPITDYVLQGSMSEGFKLSETIIGANIERARVSNYNVKPQNIAKKFEDLVLTVNQVRSKTGGFPLGTLGETSKIIEKFAKTKKMNLGAISLLRSELLGKIRELTVSGQQSNGRRIMSELVTAIDGEIEQAMKQEPRASNIFQAWEKSRDIYAEGKQSLFSNPALKSIQRRLNEGDIGGLAERLTTKANSDELRAVLGLMDTGTKEGFADVMFSKLINKASPDGLNVSGNSLLKALGGATGEGISPLRLVMKETYGETAFQNLRIFAKGLEQQQAKKGSSIGKQAITFKAMGLISAIPAGVSALAFGFNAVPIGTAAVTAGGLHLFLRALTSKKATALIIEGMKTPAKSIQAGKFMARLAKIVQEQEQNFKGAEQNGTTPVTDRRGLLAGIGASNVGVDPRLQIPNLMGTLAGAGGV